MRTHTLALGVLLLLSTAPAAQSQSIPRPTVPNFVITVADENGVAVPSARVFLQMQNSSLVRCETDFSGRCSFSLLPSVDYPLPVAKQDFSPLHLPSLTFSA